MRKNRKKTIRQSLLILLLLIGIGYAALRTTLKIDGTVGVDKTTWDVHFENVSVTNGSVTANPAPTSNDTDTTEMTYAVNFSQPGDYFEFTVDIVNDGTIDAMIDDISNSAYQNASSTTPIAIPAYLSSTVTYDDGTPIQQNQELLHNTSEKIKVRIEFKKDINVSDLPSSGDTSIVFRFKGDYKQADENAISTYAWRLPEGRTKDNLQVGDEICSRDQCFNFLHYEGTNNEDIAMLAKYNLKVGDKRSNYRKIGEYTSSDPGYGLQSSETRGWMGSQDFWGGTVIFSTTNYWDDNGTPKSDYPGSYSYLDQNYPTIYDPINYAGAPGTQTYSVAYYVENYKTLLTGYGVTIKDARLLTYAEATDSSIGCSGFRCPTTGFIANASFWFGSAGDCTDSYHCGVWGVEFEDNTGYFVDDIVGDAYLEDSYYGVRPVIVISKNNI